MKTYKEMSDDVLSRRDEFDSMQKTKRKRMIVSVFVSCLVLVAVLGVGAVQSDFFIEIKPLSQEGNNNETTQEQISGEQTSITETQPTEYQGDEGNASTGGDVGMWFIPALPSEIEFELTGEKITDEEAQEYFSINYSRITGSLSASGVEADSIKISEKGYCHISYNGVEGKGFEIRQNYRDYLVYSSDKLVAIITLFKENGEISDTPSFGAKWFDTYNSYLNAHKGEELIYVYASWFEIIIAPDNTWFNPMGYDASVYFEGVQKPYDVFYHEDAIFVP